MKIAIDVDDVIVDFANKCIELFREKGFGDFSYEKIHSYEMWKVLGISKSEVMKILDKANFSGYFDNLSLIDGAKEGVEFLRDNHDIYFVTARPKVLVKVTQKFIFREFGVNKERVFFSGNMIRKGKSKSEICEELGVGVIIEDNGFDSLKYAKSGIRVFLLDKPWNREFFHDNIFRCFSWNEVLEKIKELDNE